MDLPVTPERLKAARAWLTRRNRLICELLELNGYEDLYFALKQAGRKAGERPGMRALKMAKKLQKTAREQRQRKSPPRRVGNSGKG